MSTAASQNTGIHPRIAWWIRELPFAVMLSLTLAGVAYTSFSKQPIIRFWEILAPMIGALCIAYGWQEAKDESGRRRLIGTQLLHWLAFLVVMNLVLLPNVQNVFTANATGLAIFTLLTLGTFTAGVHVLSWQVCLLGLIMAIGIPTIAWIENTALIFVLVGAGLVGVVSVVWWRWHTHRKQ